jgi:hypothetical protein
MATKQVHSVRFATHTMTLVETRSHRFYVHNIFVAERTLGIVRVNPQVDGLVRAAVVAYAEAQGWTVC